jgi:hypothetical protein
MPDFNPEDPWDDSDVDYFGYGEEAPTEAPISMEHWQADREARLSAEDAEVARRVAAHPGYDDPRFGERQMELAKLPPPPGTYCDYHHRGLSIRESIELKGQCSWCHPELHPSYALSRGPKSQDKKDINAWRKAQQEQADIQALNAKTEENRIASEAYLSPVSVRKCIDCEGLLKPGQRLRCPPCIAAVIETIPERFRHVLAPSPP